MDDSLNCAGIKFLSNILLPRIYILLQNLNQLCKTKQTNAYATFKLFYWISEACLTLVFTSQYVIRQLPAYIVRQQKVCSKKGEKS